MARFCSECGQSTTDLMRKCPRCGAPLMSETQDGNPMVRIAIIITAMFIMLSTLIGWYNLHISIDGGVMDAMVGLATRIIPGFSGISTTYGIVIFALALTMIITTICHRRMLTAVAAVACAVVGTMAIVSPPDVMTLCSNDADSSKQLMEIFDGPMESLSPMNNKAMLPYTTIFEVITDYMVVGIGNGLKIMLILIYSSMVLSLIDLRQVIKYRLKRGQ